MRRAAVLMGAALAFGAAEADAARLRGEVRETARGLGAGMTAGPLAPTPRGPEPGPAPAPTPTPEPPAPLPRAVQARTYDRDPEALRLTLSRPVVAAGEVRVEFNNALSEDPHDLRIERVDGTGTPFTFAALEPGEVAVERLALRAGSWRLECTLFDHAERGMRAVLRVDPSGTVASLRRPQLTYRSKGLFPFDPAVLAGRSTPARVAAGGGGRRLLPPR